MRKQIIGGILASVFLLAGISYGSVAQWSQMPSLNPSNGYAFSSETQAPSLVADDFYLKAGTQITGITFWGSFWTPDSAYYPYRHSDGWGDPSSSPRDIITDFNIIFYGDIPGGSAIPPWGHPDAPVSVVNPIVMSKVTVQEYSIIARPGSTQTIYQYDLTLDRPFEMAEGTYWISIQAVNENSDEIQWGWQESGDHWGANSVQTFSRYSPIPFDQMPGEDMAFQLNSVPVPTTILLLASGIIGLLGIKRDKNY